MNGAQYSDVGTVKRQTLRITESIIGIYGVKSKYPWITSLGFIVADTKGLE